jgi:hypothetical protein
MTLEISWLLLAHQGATIIKQGDVGDFFYVVESGFCEIFVDGVGKVCLCCLFLSRGFVGKSTRRKFFGMAFVSVVVAGK